MRGYRCDMSLGRPERIYICHRQDNFRESRAWGRGQGWGATRASDSVSALIDSRYSGSGGALEDTV